MERISPRYGALLVVFATALALVLSQQAPATYRQDMSQAALPNITGLGQPEQGEGGSFRWSGGTVELALQPLGYPSYVKLSVQGVRPQEEPQAQMAISSGGKSLGLFTLPRSPSTIEVRLPASEIIAVNPSLSITSTLFQPKGDRRTLGAAFYRIEQQSGPGISLPGLWPALWVLLSGLLVYIATFALWRRTRYALVAALVWAASVGVLNALARPWLVGASLYLVVPPLTVLLVLPWLRSLIVRPPEPESEQPTALQPEPPITLRPVPIACAVTLAALAVLAWHLIAPFVPSGKGPTDNLTWGVAFYGALPMPLQLLGALIPLVAIAWSWLAPVNQAEPQAVATQMERPGFRSLALVGSAASLVIFSLLPVQYSEGDSSEFDRKIPAGAIWRERELLDFYLKARLWRLLRGWLPKPSQVYVLVATISGAVYTAGAMLLGRTLGRGRGEALVIAASLLAIGNVLLFFGYVESYALVNVTSLFVLWACWQYTRGRVSFGTVGALATLAPLFHGSALWWGPMVVAAWLLRARQFAPETRWRQARRDLREGIGVGLAMMLVMVSVAIADGYDYERLQTGLGEMGGLDGRTLLPLFTPVSPYERYVFFSWPHLGAIVQEQLLTAPLALVTVLILLVMAWPGIKQLARATPSLVTLAVGVASIFFYTTAWNPDLGPRDDWDLLSLAAPALTLLAVYLLTRLPYGRARRMALTSYISVSAVHAAGWVVLHVAGIKY